MIGAATDIGTVEIASGTVTEIAPAIRIAIGTRLGLGSAIVVRAATGGAVVGVGTTAAPPAGAADGVPTVATATVEGIGVTEAEGRPAGHVAAEEGEVGERA
jgi:hypothetical protein